jgi:hypothetical protein
MSDIQCQTTPSEALAPYATEVHDMLCSGWSPQRVCAHLISRRHAQVPIQDIILFKDTIPQSEFLPVSELAKRFKELDIEVDAVGEMGRLLRLAADRLGVAMSLETSTGQRIPYVDVASRNYWTMLREYVETRQGLGELPQAAKSASLTLPPSASNNPQQLSLRALLMVEATTPTSEGDDDGVISGGPQTYKRMPAQELLPN